jgi:GNAT superfamily N-acetyltransferase
MVEGVTIAAAGEWQLDELVAAYEWLFAPPGSTPPLWDPAVARERLAATIAADASTALVALRTGRIIGFCTAYIDLESVRFGRRCWVEDLAVDPATRSQGVGAALLGAARGWAAAAGATHLELDSGDARHDAHRFYEREGPDWTSRQFSWRLDV